MSRYWVTSWGVHLNTYGSNLIDQELIAKVVQTDFEECFDQELFSNADIFNYDDGTIKVKYEDDDGFVAQVVYTARPVV